MRNIKLLVVVNKIIDHSGPTNSLAIYNYLVNERARNEVSVSIFSLVHSDSCSFFQSHLDPKIQFIRPNPGVIGFLNHFFHFITLIYSKKFDIIQSHLTASNSVCLLFKLFRSVPQLVCTIHNKEDYMRGVEQNIIYRILGSIETRLAFLSSAYVSVSPSLQQYISLRLSKYCFSDVRSISIFNSYDYKRYSKFLEPSLTDLRASLGIPSSALLFGTIGLLIPRKNQKCSINLLRMLRDKGVDCHLIILGDGPDLATLRDYSFRIGVLHYTHFLGHKPNVQSYLSFFDFYFHPSFAEGFGFAVLEALMLSVPCICSDVEGLKDVMTPQTGFLVDIDNDYAVLNAALKLCNDLELRKYFSNQCRQSCVDRFSPYVISLEYNQLFSCILDSCL